MPITSINRFLLPLLAVAVVPVFADTTPLPASLLGNHFISFDSNSFPGQNLIGPFPAGYGGAFQAEVYPSDTTTAAGANNVPALTTVWCVDYQLDVGVGSTYPATIVLLNQIAAPFDNNVQYANQNTKWANLNIANPENFKDAQDPSLTSAQVANTAPYRYALAAALVSQYQDGSGVIDPTNPVNDSRNQSIQTAIWYLTYNSDYTTPMGPWPSGAPYDLSSNNYMYWVNWAEQNVKSVNLNDWAVISGPAPGGSLETPNGNYQTFLVEVAPTPEPGVYWALPLGLGGLLLARRFRKVRA